MGQLFLCDLYPFKGMSVNEYLNFSFEKQENAFICRVIFGIHIKSRKSSDESINQ